MESSIQEPFSLSTYATSKRLQKKSQKGGKSSLYASHTTAPTSSDGYVTVTAQGDGVHILDVRLALLLLSFLSNHGPIRCQQCILSSHTH